MNLSWAIPHYAEAPVIISIFVGVYTTCWATLQKPIKDLSSWHRLVALVGSTCIESTFIIQAFYIFSKFDTPEWLHDTSITYILGNILTWLVVTLSLINNETPLWRPYIVVWIFGALFEIGFLVSDILLPIIVYVPFNAVRLASFVLLLLNMVIMLRTKPVKKQTDVEEQQPLLSNGDANTNGTTDSTAYGTTTGTTSTTSESGDEEEEEEDRDKDIKEQQQKRLEEEGGWIGYLMAFTIFFPYIWPSKDRLGQLCVVIIILVIIADRFLNILVPRQIGIITTKVSEGVQFQDLWFDVVLWLIFQWINGWTGISLIKQIAFQYIENYSYKAISDVAFTHVMDLSMDFHSDKDSGEVIRSVKQANALNDIIDIASETVPALFDVGVGLIYLSILFDIKMAFIILAVAVIYIWAGLNLTGWTRPYRRTWVTKQREESKTLYESVSSWTTVAYFNRTKYERDRFYETLGGVISSQWGYILRSHFSTALLEATMDIGHASAIFIAIWEISHGRKPVGHLVTLLMYWSNVTYPLYNLNWSARRLVGNLIDAERILQLLRTKPTIRNAEDATELQVTAGQVEFDDVTFGYEEGRQVVKNTSFKAKPGQTIAFVGETGGGKSTMLKLLFRFYDVTGGSIKIDGQDIRGVTLSSLREQLGVVPQDPSLFNQSILDNIRYARLDATDEEIKEACKAAAVYDKIESFPKKWQSKVGERGVKLSGGELQRVAIARVLIKNPKIVLLDEATSAVDSGTEQQIQEAFKKLSIGRTTFVIAHRLSTIYDADLILVVHNGEIVERGNHDDLIKAKGRYHELWTKQTTAILRSAAPNTTTSDESPNDVES